jgi:hypothetical protein
MDGNARVTRRAMVSANHTEDVEGDVISTADHLDVAVRAQPRI